MGLRLENAQNKRAKAIIRPVMLAGSFRSPSTSQNTEKFIRAEQMLAGLSGEFVFKIPAKTFNRRTASCSSVTLV